MVLSPTGASRSLAAVFTPIKSRGLVDEVCGRIEQAVETGLLTSGQRLPNETELAAALGVSAVTAREALSQLRASGIIRTARGRSGGSFIADDVLPSRERALAQLHELSRLQIRDLGLHYQAIAAACAGVAARRSDAADIATLRSFIPAADDDSLSWRLALSEFLLEVAVVLLGASISAAAVAGAGPAFVAAIAGVVVVGIAVSFTAGKALGLGHKTALLVACGNSICGNSAIAAVAPVIGADGDEVASSIAFTAVLGVAVVLAMPFLAGVLGFDFRQYGVFAGLTVYAVPQVLAATVPVSTLSAQVGTLTKLVRVLMLGPVIFAIAILGRRPGAAKLRLNRLVPWFIVGFLGAMGLRSLGLIPDAVEAPVGLAASALTVVSMAALGLAVDLRAVARSGGRVMAAATISLLLLGGCAVAVIHGLGIV